MEDMDEQAVRRGGIPLISLFPPLSMGLHHAGAQFWAGGVLGKQVWFFFRGGILEIMFTTTEYCRYSNSFPPHLV